MAVTNKEIILLEQIRLADEGILDIDADGYISFDDLKAVLKRFSLTSFFKYTNDSTNPNINLFSSENMSETKYKSIIKKLNSYTKMKNLTDIGLFKKFDVDDDG